MRITNYHIFSIMRRKTRSSQGHVFWDNYIPHLSNTGQSNSLDFTQNQSRQNSTDLSNLFENARFDMCEELNDNPTLSLDLKRIMSNNDKLETKDRECDLGINSPLITGRSESNILISQPFSLTCDPSDKYPICSTPHSQGKEISLFDVTREHRKPRQLFDDSFGLVVDESFLKHLDEIDEENATPGESGETFSSSNSLTDLNKMDSNQFTFQECTCDAFSDSFWMNAGKVADLDVITKS